MKTMWAPWRIEYILADKDSRCIFCDATEAEGDLTLFSGTDTLVMMNKYPYINGHLLVAPLRHVATLDQLTKVEMGELLATVEQSVGILKTVMKPDGYNVGLNLGRVAGAGLEEHLHFHIVPRWSGDTNALTVFGEVRVIPEHIKTTYENLKPHFNKINLTKLN
jgi:ATP adenylyltransferase